MAMNVMNVSRLLSLHLDLLLCHVWNISEV